MKESKDHLNIDLEFLDKKESIRVAPKKPEPPKGNEPNWRFYNPNNVNSKSGKQYNWKNILIIGGIILFFVWVIFSDDSGSSSTTNTYTSPASGQNTSGGGDNVRLGEYSCSRYHYNQAVALDPDETEQQIESASSAFEYRTNALERLKDEIDNSYVNDYSDQWEIDDYNAKIDEYNSKLPAYKRDLASLDSRIDRYNAQIQKHNNYLTANCTKAY